MVATHLVAVNLNRSLIVLLLLPHSLLLLQQSFMFLPKSNFTAAQQLLLFQQFVLLTLQLQHPVHQLPPGLAGHALELSKDGNDLTYTYDAQGGPSGIAELLKALGDAGIPFKDLHTTQSSLEDIFVSLVHDRRSDERQAA